MTTLSESVIDLHRFEERIEKATQANLRAKIGSAIQVLTSFDDDEITLPFVGIMVNMGGAMGDERTKTIPQTPPFFPRGYTFEFTFDIRARRPESADDTTTITASEVSARVRAALQPSVEPKINLGPNLVLTFLTPGPTSRSVDTDERIDLSVLTFQGQIAITT
jgi:hypothetical protein